ncbi:MAG: peptide chain release factor 1 [Clostridia bacterium]|nr:peptide chain release factor 1 [Clostridia bacterium]
MLDKLYECENKYEELEHLLTEPEVLADSERYTKAATELASLRETVETFRAYKAAKAEIEDAENVLADPSCDSDMRSLAEEQILEAKAEAEKLTAKLRELLKSNDPSSNRDVVMEIRAGTGGEEAALFAAVLFRMYTKYAEGRGWQVSVADANETEIGGFKEIVFTVEGKGVYGRMKYESGVHRVQRVPQTEAGGRIHTSAATVAVFPESDDDGFELDMNEVEVDTYRSGGAGGQHINKTESAIRLTHKPTGIVVTCQDQRSQIKNKERAFKVLKARLKDLYETEKKTSESLDRRNQVGSGDRSQRIRTYNYTQNRITDHRIGYTAYYLDEFVNGKMDDLIDRLSAAEGAERLAGGSAGDGSDDWEQ